MPSSHPTFLLYVSN